uniref:ATP synthase complex subunit 8 n=1 Tax=Staphylinoidea sp. 8 KM-2017 TaxID=2219462 RepID=A0A346RI36_9COLE|nr:ATP synthase F0 subunit 8 [Staphylinoidea sp. 8 KM-2017]
MPQMAPLNWLSLFIMFIIIYIMFNFLNYYSFSYFTSKNFFTKKINKINWKW